MASSNTPHFFKIVDSQILNKGKFEVPEEFVRKHGIFLLNINQVCLKVADGVKWEVDLEKTKGGKVWFQNGFQEFTEFYSLQLNYFLVFRYEGDSCFNVIIFDLTASEIEYTSHHHHQAITVFDLSSSENIIETRKRASDKRIQAGDDSCARKTVKSGHSSSPRKQPSAATQSRVLRKTDTYKSKEKNPSFTVTMRPSYIETGKKLGIPKSFCEMHLMKSTMMVIQVSDGRTWNVRCKVRLSHNTRRAELVSGWKRFVQDNNLRVGDVCVFEMIESSEILFKVTILPSSLE